MKPLLSKLFLPCSGMHSPIRANRYPLTTITGAQRASGQTHSRARSHQGDADLRADRSTAYLVSCIRVRSAHGNSLDHLVGDQQQVTRNFEIERSGGFEIDDKFVLGRLLDREIGGFRTLQNLADIDCCAPERIDADRTIRHKAASLGNFSKVGYCRQPSFGCELHNESTVYKNELSVGEEKRIRTILSDRGEDTLDFTRPARLEPTQHHIQGTRGKFQLLPLCLTVTEVRIQKDCHLGTARNRILDELHPLGCNFR